MSDARRAPGGFTLIEVMISIAILALGLSIVFSSSVMAARATAHSRMLTNAAMLAQCRMTDVEAYLRQNQLPEADQTYEDPPETGGLRCCELPYLCRARVEIIMLPDPQNLAQNAGDRLLNAATNSAQGSTYGGVASGDGGLSGGLGSLLGGDGGMGSNPMSQMAGALGALGSMGGMGGSGGSDPMAGLAGGLGGGSGAAGSMASAGPPNLQSMASALLAGIYPTIKPLLEGAIRKVTVVVSWSEGTRPFDVTVVEYFTNPGQTIAGGDQLNALDRLTGANGAAGSTGAGTAGATTPSTTPAVVPH